MYMILTFVGLHELSLVLLETVANVPVPVKVLSSAMSRAWTKKPLNCVVPSVAATDTK